MHAEAAHLRLHERRRSLPGVIPRTPPCSLRRSRGGVVHRFCTRNVVVQVGVVVQCIFALPWNKPVCTHGAARARTGACAGESVPVRGVRARLTADLADSSAWKSAVLHSSQCDNCAELVDRQVINIRVGREQ